MQTKTVSSIRTQDLDHLKQIIVAAAKKTTPVSYMDIRVEANEGVGAYSEDGHPKATSRDWSFSLGVRTISAVGMPAAGFYGKQLGVLDFKNFAAVLKESIAIATARAKANSQEKFQFYKRSGAFGKTISPIILSPITIKQDTVEAIYDHDPRQVTSEEMTALAQEAAAAAKNHHPFLRKAEVAVDTIMWRQLFASSEGALIDQWSCFTGGTIFVLAQDNQGNTPVDLYHHTGNQLGLEAITKGKNAHGKTIIEFAKQISEEARILASAKPAPIEEKPVTIVLDPDLIALFAHEIIGHPSELDRALKMEAGYAGRSWFLTDLQNSMVGKQVGSPLLTAFSDPTLQGGYGYYRYDDEGTPAKRVYHIKDGKYTDFMNSRQTASLIGATPNGHYKANDASVVPVIRMSVSAIEGGNTDPKKIISDVEDGYYCVGHRIPSISESRENFQISPRLMYKIHNGQIGEAYRDGRITADSKDFFMSIDALGNDFKIFPIPNCGKGQPMQTKRVGNGGPTARGRAMIARGK